MRSMEIIGCGGVCLCLMIAIPVVGFAQREAGGGPLTGPTVLDAPFSADATTSVLQTLADGTRLERSATARYYRDRAGRVRVEQVIIGADAVNQAAERQVRITIYPDPGKSRVYTLDRLARTASPGSRELAGLAVGGGDTFAVPLGDFRFLVFSRGGRLRGRTGYGANAIEEELGTGLISGVEAVGRRITIPIPADQIGNNRSTQIVDERWESADLKLVTYSRLSDPRTGLVDYRLTNIRRAEPRPDLFVVPSDYRREGPFGDNGRLKLEYAEASKGSLNRQRP